MYSLIADSFLFEIDGWDMNTYFYFCSFLQEDIILVC